MIERANTSTDKNQAGTWGVENASYVFLKIIYRGLHFAINRYDMIFGNSSSIHFVDEKKCLVSFRLAA